MVRTVLYAVYFGLVLLLSQVFMILPNFILRLLGMKRASRAFMRISARVMARTVIAGLPAKISVEGLEHVPHDTHRLCIVSNHQSLFDIPIVVAYVPILAGFIAKAELKKVPFLNFWLYAMGSIMLDRKSPHSAIKAINEGVERIKNGQPICIFPEGTRSRSPKMGSFKPGSLKLALRSKAVILPVTIRNSYQLFEGPGRISPARIHVTVHPPVPTAELDSASQKTLAERLQTVIGGPLAAGNG
jgi:1-acyl-sn-glycerol-3-phosphate acyltransferase